MLCLRVRLGRLLVLVGRIVLRVYRVLFLLWCILLVLLVFSCIVPLCIHLRVGFLLWVFFRWILLFVEFCFGLVCCGWHEIFPLISWLYLRSITLMDLQKPLLFSATFKYIYKINYCKTKYNFVLKIHIPWYNHPYDFIFNFLYSSDI